jgi:hypothetical protein
MQNSRTPPPRRGFNLIEAAIVLGVIGLVVGGIWIAAASVKERLDINNFARQILTISSNWKQLYRGVPQQVGANTTITTALIDAGVIPRDMVVNGAARAPWGGTVGTILQDGDIGNCPGNNRLNVRFNYTTPAQCIGMVRSVIRQAGAAVEQRIYQVSQIWLMPANIGHSVTTPNLAYNWAQTNCAANVQLSFFFCQ